MPVGIVALVLAQRVLVESRAPGRRRMPDLLGGAAARARDRARWCSRSSRARNGAGAARACSARSRLARCSGAASSRAPAASRNPLIDLSLLRIRAFALSNGVTIVMAAGFYAYTLCNVLFLTTRLALLDPPGRASR